MSILPRGLVAAAATVALILPARLAAENRVSGSFRLGDSTFEPTHVAAFRVPSPRESGARETLIVFSVRPLTIGLAYAFDAKQAAIEEIGSDAEGRGLFLTLINGIPNYHFFDNSVPVQDSGSFGTDELVLEDGDGDRIAGRWRLEATENPLGEPRELDLRFDAAFADPLASSEPLPAGGGEAGAAYLGYLASLREGDVPAVRRFIDNPYYLRADAAADEIAEDLELIRASSPRTAEVTGGRLDATAAILEVEATTPEGSTEARRVLLRRKDGSWVFGGSADAGD